MADTFSLDIFAIWGIPKPGTYNGPDGLKLAEALSCASLKSLISSIGGADGNGGALKTMRDSATDPLQVFKFTADDIDKLVEDYKNLKLAYESPSKKCNEVSVAEPEIFVSSPNFYDVTIGEPQEKQIVIKNNGTADLIIYSIGPINSTIFSAKGWGTFPYTIPKNGGSTELTVIYSPTTVGTERPLTLSINSNSTKGSNVIVINATAKLPTDPGEGNALPKKATGTKRIFVLKNIREVFSESPNNPDINSPYFDQRRTKHSPKIVADIYQCYKKPNTLKETQSLVLEGVAIANGIGSFWYEDCNQFIGGLLPVYQYYYDVSDVSVTSNWVKIDTRDPLSLTYSVYDVNEAIKFKGILDEVRNELNNGTADWGDINNPCAIFGTNSLYVRTVVDQKFTRKTSVKIYNAINNQKQNRSVTTDPTKPDLLTPISGLAIDTLSAAYISNKAYGRLSCLSPNTGCYIVDESPVLGKTQPIGEQLVKLAKNGRSAVPEQIPSDPCYRGYRTKYIRGYMHQQLWNVQLDCLGKTFPTTEWRTDESLFEQKGQTFEVWEDVQFAGTEIGFNDVCIPDEVAKEQEPYVDASDIRGCYELHTSKIFHKYPDYSIRGMDDFIKGPETLTTQDYSGLGPGIKLSRKVQRADCIDTPVRVFHPLIKGKDIMAARDILVTKGLFNHTQSLLSYSTSSKQSNDSKKYYYDIVDETRIINGEPVTYLSVAYGNKYGSGSLYEGYEFNDSPSRAIYGQYRLLALDQSEKEFKFYSSGSYGSTRKDIYSISFNRDSLTDRIDPGNFELSLSGSGGIITLIDNSKDILEDKFSNQYLYTYFDIVSGSLSDGIQPSGSGTLATNPNLTTYGRVYPNLGFIVLDAEKLDNEISLGTNLGNNVNGDNAYKIFTAISGAASEGYPLKARSSKNKKTNHYFVRVGASTSNYTNNPTVTDEILANQNYIKNEYFRYRPTTYITTVGLYNDMNELLAVAKLSRPIIKTPDKDILIKIRLNW